MAEQVVVGERQGRADRRHGQGQRPAQPPPHGQPDEDHDQGDALPRMQPRGQAGRHPGQRQRAQPSAARNATNPGRPPPGTLALPHPASARPAALGLERPLHGQQRDRHQGQAQSAGHVAPQLVGRQQLVGQQVQLKPEAAAAELGSPAEQGGQRRVQEQGQGHGRRPGRQLIAERAPGPDHRRGQQRHRRQRPPQQIGQLQRQAGAPQQSADREQRLEVDVAAGTEAEQVRGQAVAAGVAHPGQVLELVGAEHAVGADQPIGAGERRVRVRGVRQQQHEREQGPGRECRQQHDLSARSSRPGSTHGAQAYPAAGSQPGRPGAHPHLSGRSRGRSCAPRRCTRCRGT